MTPRGRRHPIRVRGKGLRSFGAVTEGHRVRRSWRRADARATANAPGSLDVTVSGRLAIEARTVVRSGRAPSGVRVRVSAPERSNRRGLVSRAPPRPSIKAWGGPDHDMATAFGSDRPADLPLGAQGRGNRPRPARSSDPGRLCPGHVEVVRGPGPAERPA